jgi:drug/metabolite transporter (DMT)-like permease
MRTPQRWQADLSLALVALVWGSTFVVVKRALSEISTVYFLALRFGLASVCMLLIFMPAFIRSGRATVRKGLQGGAAAGLLLWLGYLLQTFGLKFTTAGKSGFLTGLYIVLVPPLGAMVYGRWPQFRELAAIVIAGAGLVVMTFPAISGKMAVNLGDLLTVGCAVAFAGHILVLSHYAQRGQVQAVALGQIMTAALLSTGSLLLERPAARWSSKVIFALVLTAIFATAIAFAIQTWCQRYTTATRTALIFALEPVFALATAVLVGNEPLTASALTGGALIMAGVLAVELKPAAMA